MMSDTLLAYAVSTDPDPLRASAASGAPSLGALTVVVSNGTKNVINCAGIAFSFPVGENAKDLTTDMIGVATAHPPGWSIRQTGGLFTATPDTPEDGRIGQAGLAFTFSKINVNTQPGTFTLAVTEQAGSPVASRTTEITLSKFPADFAVGDLRAEPLSVSPGGETTLFWGGTDGATYTLQYDGVTITETRDETPQPLPATGSYRVGDIYDDTVFNLVVTVGVDGQDAPLVFQRQRQVTVLRARIIEFNGEPLTIGKGATCNFWWETNADECFLDPLRVPVDAPNGSKSMTFDATTNVTLTAIIDGDKSHEAQLTRTVTVVPPVLHSFTATPADPLDFGGTATLSWETQYASSVKITPNVGVVEAVGSTTVAPAADTVYTLTCEGFGADVKQTLAVKVLSVEIESFAADPPDIQPGASATLHAAARRVVSASILPGVGAVSPDEGGILGAHCIVSPSADTTYTLTCEGPNGTVERSLTVGVNVLQILKFELKSAGGTAAAKLTWETKLADECFLTIPVFIGGSIAPFQSPMPTRGSYTYPGPHRWQFTLVARGGGREVKATVVYPPAK